MENKKQKLAVGIFVLVGSLLAFGVILLLGEERGLFTQTVPLYVQFEDVGGLKPGSQVRLAGMTIGSVTGIDFSPKIGEKELHVEMKILADMLVRIRKDSIATIATKGLLGDKVIEITIGSKGQPPIKPNDYVESREPPDMFKILESGQSLIADGADVAADLKKTIKSIANEGTLKHINNMIASLDSIIEEVETGKGVANGLIFDKQVNFDLKATMRNVRQTSEKLNQTVGQANDILTEVKTGKGPIHSVIYEKEGTELIHNLRDASKKIAELADEIQTGDGMLHTLVYSTDKGNIIKNLELATADIKELAAYIKKGNGTIGALIKDPTVFEDLKLILGNLKRNAVLKSLIRMSLEKDEEQKKALSEKARIKAKKKSPKSSKSTPKNNTKSDK